MLVLLLRYVIVLQHKVHLF